MTPAPPQLHRALLLIRLGRAAQARPLVAEAARLAGVSLALGDSLPAENDASRRFAACGKV